MMLVLISSMVSGSMVVVLGAGTSGALESYRKS